MRPFPGVPDTLSTLTGATDGLADVIIATRPETHVHSAIGPNPKIVPVLVGPFPVFQREAMTTTGQNVAAIPRPAHGGVSATNAKLSTMLDQRGIRHERIDLSSDSRKRTVFHHLIRLRRTLKGMVDILFAPGPAVRHYDISLDGGPGLIHNILIILAIRLRGAPFLLYHHSTNYVLADKFLMTLLVTVAGKSPTHMACSRRMFELYRARYGVPDKFLLLSNAAWIAPSPLPQLPSDPGKITLGYLGSLSVDKGSLRALDTFLEIRRRGGSARIVIAGGGVTPEVRQRIDDAQRLHGEDMTYLGAIADEEKWRLFSRIDYFLFPTLYPHETQSSVAPEAMSAGVPVVAYDHRFVGELIGAEGGTLIPTSAPFAQAAADWIMTGDSIALREERRHRVRAHYDRIFAEARMQLETLIATLVAPA